jgi:hypothetical protein
LATSREGNYECLSGLIANAILVLCFCSEVVFEHLLRRDSLIIQGPFLEDGEVAHNGLEELSLDVIDWLHASVLARYESLSRGRAWPFLFHAIRTILDITFPEKEPRLTAFPAQWLVIRCRQWRALAGNSRFDSPACPEASQHHGAAPELDKSGMQHGIR